MEEKPGAVTVSFTTDIQPLFRVKDVNAMKKFGGFDLSKFDDVVTHADSILRRLKASITVAQQHHDFWAV